MEAVGLALAVAAAVVPTYRAITALSNRVADTKNFPRKLRMLNAQVMMQMKLFDNECRLLFWSEFDEALVKAMLANEKHTMWANAEFQGKLKGHLGEYFGESCLPFEIIRETVAMLQAEIDKVTLNPKAGVSSYAPASRCRGS